MREDIAKIHSEITKVVRGKDDIILKVLTAMLAGGHILLEDIPGVGKTTMAVTLSKTMDMNYHRVQFTPDVLPSDITGFSMYNSKTGEFEYRPGSALCNLFLADEINRTSPKTQSALLEVMEEGKVTVDGVSHDVPNPFVVIATQNPLGSSGTQRMPESQMDRFLVRLRMGYPKPADEKEILLRNGAASMSSVEQVIGMDDMIRMRKEVLDVHIEDDVYDYIVALATATRSSAEIALGLSPRGTLAVMRMARANAYIQGRDYVTVGDVLENFHEVSEHRVVLSAKAKASGLSEKEVVEHIVASVRAPKV